MSFSRMLEILQERSKDKIVLINAGAFYIATGKDAVLLHDKLDLKCTCFTNHMYKVGVPINSIQKYMKEIEKNKYAYIVYYYDKDKKSLTVKYEKDGKKNTKSENNINCLLCKGVGVYKDDEYYIALNEFLKNEYKKVKEEDE